MAKKHIWKLWLSPNFLTKDVENDYVAEVSTVGNTLKNADIARQIVEGRSEFRYETILSILNERDAIARNALLIGSSVQDSNIHTAPLVPGAWTGTTPVFDPEKHNITVVSVPTAELHKALSEEVGVEILGIKTDGGARIGLVTDTASGKTDGTITPSQTIVIEGEKIKVFPDDESDLGVFFVAEDGTETQVSSKLTMNDPKKIICVLPPLTVGTYTLKIVTRFSSGKTRLKEPRTMMYKLPLNVKE
jgi:hypothetical protein